MMKKMMTAFSHSFDGFEMFHSLFVFSPEGGKGGLVEAEDLLSQFVE